MTDFTQSIRTTGFCLEHWATMTLRRKGWSVINNRYYLDDQSGSVREIDLVAYRVSQVDHLLVYTVLLISCKKSEKNAWSLLSRSSHQTNPNIDRRPVHIWTNDNAAAWMIRDESWRERYFNLLVSEGNPLSIIDSNQDVFAFQEVDKASGRVQNDKAIFSSVTSLIKAQAYELEILPNRKKEPSLYQFSLLSLFEGDLIRLDFSDENDEISEAKINEALYFCDYIVHQSRTTAKIHFVRKLIFDEVLDAYKLVELSNIKFFGSLVDRFYSDALKNSEKRKSLQPEFEKKVKQVLRSELLRKGFSFQYVKTEVNSLKDNKEEVCVHVITKKCSPFIITDSSVRDVVKCALKDVYHFSGRFRIEVDDIPF